MVGIGTACFLQPPNNSKQRVLHPARVVGLADETYTVESEEVGLTFEPDMDVLLFFEEKREFMKQSARIEAVDALDADDDGSDTGEIKPQHLISFKTTGAPVSADSRQCHRVSTVMMKCEADVNAEKACRVLDISSSGLAIISKESYEIGKVVHVTLAEGGQAYNGSVCVQSIHDLGKGQTRYGLHCVSDPRAQDTLAKGLRNATMRIQREQLRRLARTA